MSKPVFAYRLYCETCDVQVSPRNPDGVPQSKAAIEEERRYHARMHELGKNTTTKDQP